MTLLLDEMFSPVIARELTRRGHDVVSIYDQELGGKSDDDVAAFARARGWIVMTENVSDFIPIQQRDIAEGRAPVQLVLTTNSTFPRGHPATIGRLVRALDQLLRLTPSLPVATFVAPVDDG